MKWVRVAVSLSLPWALTVAARAQEFSAVSVTRDTTGHVVKSKVYKSGDKVRSDPEEAGAANEQAYVILDLAQRTATVITAKQKIYMRQSPGKARQSLQFWVSGASPCPAGVPCKDDGAEALNGRSAEKWEFSQSLQGQTLLTRVWVDARLHIWTKVQVMAGVNPLLSYELQEIQEGPQPASLFLIPAGFLETTTPKRGG